MGCATVTVEAVTVTVPGRRPAAPAESDVSGLAAADPHSDWKTAEFRKQLTQSPAQQSQLPHKAEAAATSPGPSASQAVVVAS